jgi:hypothetical protein
MTAHAPAPEASFSATTSAGHRLALAIAPDFRRTETLRASLAAAPSSRCSICSCNAGFRVGVNQTPKNNATESAARSDDLVNLGTLGGASGYAAAINSGTPSLDGRRPLRWNHAFRWNAGGEWSPGARRVPSRAVAVRMGRDIGMSGEDGRWTPVIWSASGSISILAIPQPGVRDCVADGIQLPRRRRRFRRRRTTGWIWSSNNGNTICPRTAER